ncbi:MAG: response regulator [Bdellovibrionales bacterium]|nr:response regulator [Bdellovibrionales bacterium]NQZ20386.1 response regulator [Bdellovibrionales bacterium]
MSIKTRKWILLAEDEDDIRESIRDYLIEKFGDDIKLVESTDGGDAITKIKNQTFHLIITDIKMPRKDGDHVIEEARSSSFNETTPIIVISAFADKGVEQKHKFVSFLPKPINNDELVGMIRVLFKIGSTEKMISASIFSSLLDSSLVFLKEALHRKDFEVGEMQLKKRGQPLEAERAAIIKVYIGNVSNTFSVLCSEQTLNELKESSDRLTGTSLDVICRSLGFVILKHVLTECGIIDSNEVHTKDITQDPSILTNKQGIVVPIKAKNIDYMVFATTKGGD